MAHLEFTRERNTENAEDLTNIEVKGRQLQISKWLFLLVVVAFLVIWEVVIRFTMLLSPLFFPPPSHILQTLVEYGISGNLWTNLWHTTYRFSLALLSGGTSGLLCGMAAGSSIRVRNFFDPLVAMLHPLPKIALLPLVMILLGIGETSKIVVIAISVFFPMFINAMSGVSAISPRYLEIAQNYGASRLDIVRFVALPGSLPSIFAGIRIAVNIAWVVTIAIELVASTTGLGHEIWFVWQLLQVDKLFANLIVIAVIGYLTNVLIDWIQKRAIPWQT